MELNDTIQRRRTVRDFLPDPIPESAITEALTHGLLAPSHNHKREWDYILIRSQELRSRLFQTESAPDSQQVLPFGSLDPSEAMYRDAIPKQEKMLVTSPLVIAFVYKPKKPLAEISRIYDLNPFASVWTSIENVLLSLADKDIYGVTFIPRNTRAVGELLNLPEGRETAALVAVGKRNPSVPLPRRTDETLENHVHREKWESR